MFEGLVKTVVDGGHGVRAYDACARAAREQIVAEPTLAAPLTLIMVAAQGIVEAYDDQPLPVDGADAILQNFKEMAALLGGAFEAGDADAKVAALNAAAVKLAEVSKN